MSLASHPPFTSLLTTILPPPIYADDPPLLSRILVHLHKSCGLEHGERLVLAAVLQNMPVSPKYGLCPSTTSPPNPHVSSPATPMIDRILSLGVPELKLLASLFTTALLDARSWGGRRNQRPDGSTTSSTPDIHPPTDTSALYDPLFRLLDISWLPALPEPGEETPEPRSLGRKKRQTDNCLLRQLSRCPITLKELSLEQAHIIPHSIAAFRSTTAIPFWMLLVITLGSSLRDEVFNIVSGINLHATHNSLGLDATLHKYFDQGVLYLAPTGPYLDKFDPATCRQYDITFSWRSNLPELSTCATRVHTDPEDQLQEVKLRKLAHVHNGPLRGIENGDRFRIFTNDPGALPLPHPVLLEIHGMLWRMIQSAGMAESGRGKKRRFAEAAIGGDGDGEAGRMRRGSTKGSRGTSRKGREGKDSGSKDNSEMKQGGLSQDDTQETGGHLVQHSARPEYDQDESSVSSGSSSSCTVAEDDTRQSHDTASSFCSSGPKGNPEPLLSADIVVNKVDIPPPNSTEEWNIFQSRLNELWPLSPGSSRSSPRSPPRSPPPTVVPSRAWLDFQLRHLSAGCCGGEEPGEESGEEYSGDEVEEDCILDVSESTREWRAFRERCG